MGEMVERLVASLGVVLMRNMDSSQWSTIGGWLIMILLGIWFLIKWAFIIGIPISGLLTFYSIYRNSLTAVSELNKISSRLNTAMDEIEKVKIELKETQENMYENANTVIENQVKLSNNFSRLKDKVNEDTKAMLSSQELTNENMSELSDTIIEYCRGVTDGLIIKARLNNRSIRK